MKGASGAPPKETLSTSCAHNSAMNVLLIQPEGVDLYATLLKSETSREVLRFYQPDRLAYGVRVRTASLGSALALVSELGGISSGTSRRSSLSLKKAYSTHPRLPGRSTSGT